MGTRSVKVRHSKASYVGGAIGSFIFMLIGLLVVIPATNYIGGAVIHSTSNIQGPEPTKGFGFLKLFGILWTLIAVYGFFFSLYNIFSQNGVPIMEIDMPDNESGADSHRVTTGALPSSESRLRELESLRGKGLISQAEYDDKRREILRDV